MLPAHYGRRRRHLLGRAVSRTLQGRGWQVCLGLLLLLVVTEWKASRGRGEGRRRAAAYDQQIAAVQQVVGEQERLIHEVTARLEAAEKAAKSCRPPAPPLEPLQLHRHKMAVIVPYRDRGEMLAAFLPALTTFLKAQGRDFGLFVMEQTARLRFNRGLLLNAGALLLADYGFDYVVFHDVDTLPTEAGAVPYDYPSGQVPLHLTPPGIHPKVRYEDFFGGVTAFTQEQLRRVNGYGNDFWGWGREDDNMRLRLQRAGMWPPQRPALPRRSPAFYFRHSLHPKAAEVRVRQGADGERQFFETNPDTPYDAALIVSSQPGVLDDFDSGLSNARFWVKDVAPVQGLAVRFLLELYCDRNATPWCES